ncbi:glycosyltransferase 2 [Ancistrocladus abbreviatus]
MDWKMANKLKVEGSVQELEQKAMQVASCTYELNTRWGQEMGMKYGIAVEDIVTGLVIQCRGWRSVYFNPERLAYMGLAPTTLAQALAQQKRWGEGNIQIMLSRYCPLVLAEFLYSKGTVKGYWKGQRMWLYKQTSSYLIAFIDTVLTLIRLSNMKFAVTAKVSDDDVSQRYEIEIMESGVSSPMFTVLGTLGMLNLFGFGIEL